MTLAEIKKPLLMTSDTVSGLALFNSLIQKQQHMAILLDEYGGVEGLVTLEDIFETILGREIVDETDKVVDMQVYAKRLNQATLDQDS